MGLASIRFSITRGSLCDTAIWRRKIRQLNGIATGLLKAVSQRRRGEKVYMAGMMARILAGGRVRAGDAMGVLEAAPTASQ